MRYIVILNGVVTSNPDLIDKINIWTATSILTRIAMDVPDAMFSGRNLLTDPDLMPLKCRPRGRDHSPHPANLSTLLDNTSKATGAKFTAFA